MAGLMEGWYLLHRTTDPALAAILRGVLEENQVPVVVLDKKDSAYVLLGEIYIYVPSHFSALSQSLVSGSLTN